MTQKVKDSVDGAVHWFENHEIHDVRVETETLADGRKNRIIVKDVQPLWG